MINYWENHYLTYYVNVNVNAKVAPFRTVIILALQDPLFLRQWTLHYDFTPFEDYYQIQLYHATVYSIHITFLISASILASYYVCLFITNSSNDVDSTFLLAFTLLLLQRYW